MAQLIWPFVPEDKSFIYKTEAELRFCKWNFCLNCLKSRSIAFLAISDQYATFDLFCHKIPAGGHFWWPKIAFDRISRHFRSICNFFAQNSCRRPFWMTNNVFLECISRHFRSIRNDFFSICGFGLFWITENNFQSHFSPFQINTQFFWAKNK